MPSPPTRPGCCASGQRDADLPNTHRRRPVGVCAQEVSRDADHPYRPRSGRHPPLGWSAPTHSLLSAGTLTFKLYRRRRPVLRKRSAGTLTFHTCHGAVGILRWGGRRLLWGGRRHADPVGQQGADLKYPSPPTRPKCCAEVSEDADLHVPPADPSGVRKRSARTLTFHDHPRRPVTGAAGGQRGR